MYYAVASTSVAGLIIILAVLILLQRVVLNPLTRLSTHAHLVGTTGDLSQRLSLSRQDEIGTLAQFFDRMVEQLSLTMNNLKTSEEMYCLITESSLSFITLIQDERFIYLNKRAIEMSGYSPGEITGMYLWEIAHPDDREWVQQRTVNIQNGEAMVHFEFRYLTKQGKTRWLEILAVPIEYQGDKAILVHGIDITEKKVAQLEQLRLEEKLQRVRKMELIGNLAGGVAHDLNNILSGIVTYPDLLLLDIAEDSPLRKPLLTIRESGQKAATIVQDLLTLSRRGVAISEVVNLNDLITQYLLSPEHKKMLSYHPFVTVETQLARNLCNIKGSPIHLSKAIMNLISNAAEAMPDGGRIVITTENRAIKTPVQGYEIIEEGEYAVLSVTDNGVGILPEEREKIFEPFFTKKVMGRSGTGLGMTVVWSTVKDHYGYVDLQSTEGSGTTFTLYFPVTKEINTKNDLPPSIESYMGKGEKILVIDDVKTQRDIAADMLTKLGYAVSVAASGEEAIEQIKKNKPNLILLDMIMHGGMDGLETYKKILRIHPTQKVLIVSGYSESEKVKEARRLGAGEYIGKPYSLEKIGMAIRKALSYCICS